MKQFFLNAIVATALALVLSACEVSKDTQNELAEPCNYYNIVLVVDGTDRIAHQNMVPDVNMSDVKILVDSLVNNGEGSLYVTYVDENCKNNDFAMLRWKHTLCPRFLTLKDKASYEQQKEFNKRLEENVREIEQWRIDSANIVQPFYEQCQHVLVKAYDDEVTLKSKASDVYGAINQALNMIESSRKDGDDNNYIVLVSDCEDNVGTQLDSIPAQGVELLLVNGTSCQTSIDFKRKFVAIKQVIEYMFNK